MTKKVISIILTFVMLFSVTSGSLTVDAATKNTVKTSISKVESKAKGFKVTWKKKSKIKGYQIQYSTSSKFKKSSTKTKSVSGAKTKSATISKLKGCNTKYYVRVRTYKLSNGKKVYSSWSKTKKITTLKHKYSKATCTKAKVCKYCKKTSGKALGHSYGSWETIRKATETKNGLKVRECGKCGDEEEKTIKKKNSSKKYSKDPKTCAHSWSWLPGGIVKCPTVESEGKELWICGDCGHKTYTILDKRPAKYVSIPDEILIYEKEDCVRYVAVKSQAKLTDYREWGDLPTIKILKDKSWKVTYYDKKNNKRTFIIKPSGDGSDGVIRSNGECDTI